VVCTFFMENRCRNGYDCKFAHPIGEDAKARARAEPPLCRYFLHGRCMYGASCWYRHALIRNASPPPPPPSYAPRSAPPPCTSPPPAHRERDPRSRSPSPESDHDDDGDDDRDADDDYDSGNDYGDFEFARTRSRSPSAYAHAYACGYDPYGTLPIYQAGYAGRSAARNEPPPVDMAALAAGAEDRAARRAAAETESFCDLTGPRAVWTEKRIAPASELQRADVRLD
jgi:hypothetical protein